MGLKERRVVVDGFGERRVLLGGVGERRVLLGGFGERRGLWWCVCVLLLCSMASSALLVSASLVTAVRCGTARHWEPSWQGQ